MNKKPEQIIPNIIRTMPELSHWPNRPEPFDPANSEVLEWMSLQREIREWIESWTRRRNEWRAKHNQKLLDLDDDWFRIMDDLLCKARSYGLVVFDTETRYWRGCDKETIGSEDDTRGEFPW